MGGKPRTRSVNDVPLDPTERAELIEQFRQVGIRLDKNGVFWHQGAAITHQRLARALRKWLDVTDDGRPILRLDETRYAYVDVDDAFLLIESIHWQGDVPIATINDGSSEPLACDTLHVGAGFALYALVRDRRLLARLTTRAYYSLAERIEEDGAGFALRARGALHRIEQVPG